MIKHIVFFKLKKENKEENMKKVKELLLSLKNKIPEIMEMEVGFDFSKTPASYDIALYTVFKSKKDLDTYMNHPLHQEVVKFITEVREDRAVVDYEV